MTDALYQEYLRFLQAPGFDAPQLNAFMAHMEKMRQILPADVRLEIAEKLRRAPPTSDTVRLHSTLFYLTGDLYYLEHILHYYLMVSDRAGPELLHYTLWCIQRLLFLGLARPEKAASFTICDLFRFYQQMMTCIADRWDLRPVAKPRRDGQPLRRVLFITNQFLGDRHQPSRDCFDFARRLRDNHRLDTLIINGNLMPLEAANTFVPFFSATLIQEFSGLQTVQMFGDKMHIASFTETAFSQKKLKSIMAMIERFDPDVIVAFGGTNIMADLYAMTGARPVILLPTTTGLTMSLADLILGFDAHDWTADLPDIYRPPFAGRFRPFTFGYSLPPLAPEEDGYTLPDGAFIYTVVGTRLDAEVTPAFITLLEDLLDRVPDSVVAFAGGVNAPLPARLAASRHAARLLSLGHVADIRSFYRRCGAFLNPPRQGGGGGVAYALAEGLPVVSHAQGDGASVAGADFLVADDRAFIDRAAALADDPALRATAAETARQRFAAIGGRDQAVAALLGYCREALGLSGG